MFAFAILKINDLIISDGIAYKKLDQDGINTRPADTTSSGWKFRLNNLAGKGLSIKLTLNQHWFSVSCMLVGQHLFYSTKVKWNESGFRPPLCTYNLNWARRTSWGWWDDWDDTVLQTQDSKFEPWRSEAEHATSRSRRLPTILTFTRGWRRNIFVSFKSPRPGTEPRTLAWKAAVLTTTLGPPPQYEGKQHCLLEKWAVGWVNIALHRFLRDHGNIATEGSKLLPLLKTLNFICKAWSNTQKCFILNTYLLGPLVKEVVFFTIYVLLLLWKSDIISQIGPAYYIFHDHDNIYFYVVGLYVYACHYINKATQSGQKSSKSQHFLFASEYFHNMWTCPLNFGLLWQRRKYAESPVYQLFLYYYFGHAGPKLNFVLISCLAGEYAIRKINNGFLIKPVISIVSINARKKQI